jgi:intracellular septation protein A
LPVTPAAERPDPAAVSVKHWRSFGPAEWHHVKEGVIGLVLGSLLPVAWFYVTYRLWGFSPAVVVVLVSSALVFAWHRRRTGGADVFSATTFGFACVKALAGLASQNTWLYLAWPSLENVVYGTAFFGSALLGRPLLALFAERLYPIPPAVRQTHVFRRAFLVASAAWLLGHSARAVLRLYLLAHLPLELYLIADTVAGWPINITLVAFTTWYPLREMRRAGLLDAPPRTLDALDVVDLAVEEAEPSTV